MCDSILQQLHDYWLSLRLSAMPLPAAHLVHDSNSHGQLSSGPTLSEVRDAYIKLKGVGKDKTFIRGASRNGDAVLSSNWVTDPLMAILLLMQLRFVMLCWTKAYPLLPSSATSLPSGQLSTLPSVNKGLIALMPLLVHSCQRKTGREDSPFQ
jgi:hypothetical protein